MMLVIMQRCLPSQSVDLMWLFGEIEMINEVELSVGVRLVFIVRCTRQLQRPHRWVRT